MSSKAVWIVGQYEVLRVDRSASALVDEDVRVPMLHVMIVLVIPRSNASMPQNAGDLVLDSQADGSHRVPERFFRNDLRRRHQGKHCLHVRSDAFQPGGAYSASDSDWYSRQVDLSTGLGSN